MWEVVFPNHPMSQNLWKGWDRVGVSREHRGYQQWVIHSGLFLCHNPGQPLALQSISESLRLEKPPKIIESFGHQSISKSGSWQLLRGISW